MFEDFILVEFLEFDVSAKAEQSHSLVSFGRISHTTDVEVLVGGRNL